MGWTSDSFFEDSPVSSSGVHERVNHFVAAQCDDQGALVVSAGLTQVALV